MKLAASGLLLITAGVGFRFATAKVNTDFRNYEVLFEVPKGWTELPKNPNTLLLIKHPKSQDLLRCSATQVVSEFNPEPDVDTMRMVNRVVLNAQENQPNWKTVRLKPFDNGKMGFELFQKTNEQKTIVVAMSVRGNTTVLVSVSNTGAGAKLLAENHDPLLDFLANMDLTVTDKWNQMHARMGSE